MNGKHKLPWPYHTSKLAPYNQLSLRSDACFKIFNSPIHTGKALIINCATLYKNFIFISCGFDHIAVPYRAFSAIQP